MHWSGLHLFGEEIQIARAQAVQNVNGNGENAQFTGNAALNWNTS